MNFTWVAEDYFQNSQFQYEHAQYAISRYDFTGNESVLDVGCGDGKITAELADRLKEGAVVGVDSSEAMIKFASAEFAKNRPNLNFNVCSAEKINYLNKFDVVFSFACLHWVKDQMAFLIGAKKALKDNGKIIITLYPKHPYIWEAIDETVNAPTWQEYFNKYENPHINYSKSIYQKLASKAGLVLEYLEEEVPIAYFKCKADMETFLRSWLPHTDQIHPQLREKFLSNIGSTFLKKVGTKNEKLIEMPFRRLDIVLAKK